YGAKRRLADARHTAESIVAKETDPVETALPRILPIADVTGIVVLELLQAGIRIRSGGQAPESIVGVRGEQVSRVGHLGEPVVHVIRERRGRGHCGAEPAGTANSPSPAV